MSDEIYSFKAGRVDYNDTNGEATPVRGQGKVVLQRSSEDPSLLAILWKPRSSYLRAQPTEQLMILPGDVEFEHVKECTTGRVISMKFMSSGKRTLYWLQDPPQGDLDQMSTSDQEILDKLRELSNTSFDDEDEEMEDDR